MRPPQRINFQGNRRVFPVLGAYIGASFAFVGVADATLGNIGGPEWAFEYLIIALLAGFPVTFALAWFFQITKALRAIWQ